MYIPKEIIIILSSSLFTYYDVAIPTHNVTISSVWTLLYMTIMVNLNFAVSYTDGYHCTLHTYMKYYNILLNIKTQWHTQNKLTQYRCYKILIFQTILGKSVNFTSHEQMYLLIHLNLSKYFKYLVEIDFLIIMFGFHIPMYIL